MFYFILKFIFLFLLGQHLFHRSGFKGLTLKWPWLHGVTSILLLTLVFILTYTSSHFPHHWVAALFMVFAFTLFLGCFWSVNAYNSPYQSYVCNNGVEYFHFPSKIKEARGVKVFFHGAGNDALFDNFELFNTWYEQGFRVIAVNLPGHGLQGVSLLDTDTAESVLLAAWEQIKHELHLKEVDIGFIGESMGAAFALRLSQQLTEVSHAHLLCAPVAVAVPKIGMVWEVFHFFFFQLWWRLGSNTFWQAIPSFSWFKRGLYPVRHPRKYHNRMQAFSNTIEHLYSRNTDKALITNTSLNVLLFHGLFDGVIPFKQAGVLNSALSDTGLRTILLPTRAAHLSIKKWYVKYLNLRS